MHQFLCHGWCGVPSPTSYAEALTCNVMVFRDQAQMEVIKVK
jgi:hypothetical protein